MSLSINADDYALHAPGDDAILALAERGRLSSTTAMVLSPRWPQAAQRLRAARLDAGLHLDFTSAFAAPPAGRGVAGVIAASWLRQWPRAALRAQVAEQFTRFEDALGRAPACVDGHQHVHQFPQIRDVLLDVIAERYASAERPALRVCATRHWRGAKAAVIAALGSAALAQAAARAGLRTNDDFAGVYGFEPRAELPALWRGWLRGAARGLLVMCHVSTSAAPQPGDPITAARAAEFSWLSSDAFAQLCAEHGGVQRWADAAR